LIIIQGLIYIRNHHINQDDQVRNFSKYLLAMGESVYDNRRIKTLVQPTLTTKIDDREMFMKGIDYSYYYEQED